jgi:hypothetical protein
MAVPQMPWTISKEDIEAVISMPPILNQFYDQMVNVERKYLEEGIRRALGLWVSELEPSLMYRVGQTRPFGVTAVGHWTPYIEIKWDDNFYLTGEPIRYPVSYRQALS